MSSSTWSSMKNSVLDQSGYLQSRGSNNVRKECCEWSAVTCRNEKTSSVQVYNCQTLNLQGGVEMQSRERNSLMRKIKEKEILRREQLPQHHLLPNSPCHRKRNCEPDGSAAPVALMMPHDDIDDHHQNFPSFKDHVAEARRRCFEALAYVTALEQRMHIWDNGRTLSSTGPIHGEQN